VTFRSGEGNTSLLTGFTLTGGTGSAPPFGGKFGGAIFVLNSEPVISKNVIYSNSAGTGAGIWCGGLDGNIWRPVIVDNEIISNTANLNGGGIGLSETVVADIRGNSICGNAATLGDGGGLWCRITRDGLTVINNKISENKAGDHGGGMYAGQPAEGLPPLGLNIEWNLFVGNIASGRGQTGNSGGGVWLRNSAAWTHHNTFVENIGLGGNSTYGGGIVLEDLGLPLIEQNIIAFNSGGGIWCANGNNQVIRNNLAWQNQGGEGIGACSAWWQTEGNISYDPYFCGRSLGDFTVASNSSALIHPAGPLGAFPTPGCGPVAVERSTWGSLKARYSSPR
jgi:parallel beta helix pectate lyase-like protein